MDLFDKLPTPYGQVRTGVAPDHPNIESVTWAGWQAIDAVETATGEPQGRPRASS